MTDEEGLNQVVTQKKLMLILGSIIILTVIFAQKMVDFYIDWLWFENYGFGSVLLTMVGSKIGFGFGFGISFFLITWFALRMTYNETSHLPVLLAEEVRREVPILDLIASNLRPLVFLAPLLLGAATGLVGAQKWDLSLKFLNAESFGAADPIFGNDYSFYLFTYPFLGFVKNVLWEAWVLVAVGVGLISFFKRTLYVDASGIGILPQAKRSISILACMAFLLFAWNFHFARFEMLMEGNGVVNGIGYAEDNGRVPALNLCVFFALAGAVVSAYNVFQSGLRKLVLAGAVIGIVYLGGSLYPNLLQKFVVAPNELVKETPYIEHSIAATNLAFGLDKVENSELPGTSTLTAKLIEKNRVTIDNIRLWDEEPLLDTLGQIQEIRTYYQFASADNDRYKINGTYQQTLLSPRELDSANLPNRTWINEHLTFTHGYGLALSPVNQITPEGLPVLFIKDIPPSASVNIQVERPEIYFGELSNDHVFVNTDTKEFDYPEGEKNVYKNYAGKGGIQIGSFLNKAVMAMRFKTLKILFSDDIRPDSRVLMNRNINDRVRQVAPFLTFDRDPYLVISSGRLVWIYDAYTVSDDFPYSQPIGGFGNYIRNSVKVVIDAYDGNMDFYVADVNDPIIRTYRKIFPGMFKNLESMPIDLRAHLRYPFDLFTLQTFIYATYHMKTPQVFYNKEDQWEVPQIDNSVMQAYYTVMKLPEKEREEYILMIPFTPRGKSNLSAWMIARSDGKDYGKLAVYTFPKQRLVYGPSQIVARINQEAEISRQISLWDQRGSSVIQGNLLVIPIEESLIYVRPLYLKADEGKIPELKRVIVSYEDHIAMEKTLDEALGKIFSGISTPQLENDISSVARLANDPGPGGKVVLERGDYFRIQQGFQKALKAQKSLETSLEVYKSGLESLGQALSSARIFNETKKESVGNN